MPDNSLIVVVDGLLRRFGFKFQESCDKSQLFLCMRLDSTASFQDQQEHNGCRLIERSLDALLACDKDK